MKSCFNLFFLLALSGAVLWAGCEAKVAPVGAYSAPAMTTDRTVVVDFNSVPSTLPSSQPPSGPLTDINGFPVSFYPVNPQLFEPVPGNQLQFPGLVQVVNNFGLYENAILDFEGPGANNSPWAAHVSGAVTDLGNNVFPAVDFQIPMESGSKYDMSFFTGVNFYYKTSAADTVLKRVFQIPTLQTQAPPAGNCDNSTNKCYDHFTLTLPNTNGVWQKFSVKFTDLTRGGFGWPMNPPNLTGENLKEVLWLQWEESNANLSGTKGVDFWVDEVQFFK